MIIEPCSPKQPEGLEARAVQLKVVTKALSESFSDLI
jgi:hypothetical protein